MAARKKTAKRTTTKRTTKKRTTKASAGRKKAASKKAPARAAAGAKPARITSAVKPRTKSEIYGVLAEHAGISKKEVAAVFETMATMIGADLKKGKAEQFTVPGLMKVTVQRKPATKARKGINPFTGEPTIFKAKPARNVVKVRPMKGLKDLV
ncbi:MAG: HU family DNA-binding protein [Planctomycetota bacterium]